MRLCKPGIFCILGRKRVCMKKLCLFLAVGLAFACTAPKHAATADANGSQDGKSFETAVVIQEKHETVGVHAEYAWCADHYPGYKTKMQAFTTHGKKPYDILTIETADGQEMKVYFDISNFFGKF